MNLQYSGLPLPAYQGPNPSIHYIPDDCFGLFHFVCVCVCVCFFFADIFYLYAWAFSKFQRQIRQHSLPNEHDFYAHASQQVPIQKYQPIRKTVPESFIFKKHQSPIILLSKQTGEYKYNVLCRLIIDWKIYNASSKEFFNT